MVVRKIIRNLKLRSYRKKKSYNVCIDLATAFQQTEKRAERHWLLSLCSKMSHPVEAALIRSRLIWLDALVNESHWIQKTALKLNLGSLMSSTSHQILSLTNLFPGHHGRVPAGISQRGDYRDVISPQRQIAWEREVSAEDTQHCDNLWHMGMRWIQFELCNRYQYVSLVKQCLISVCEGNTVSKIRKLNISIFTQLRDSKNFKTQMQS